MGGPVLLVEGDDDVRVSIAELLEDAGHRVVAMGRAADALRWLEVEQPGVILLNSRLPDLSARRFIGCVREHGRFGSSPVVVVSGASAPIKGADAHLTLPVDAEDLLATVSRFTDLSGLPPPPRG